MHEGTFDRDDRILRATTTTGVKTEVARRRSVQFTWCCTLQHSQILVAIIARSVVRLLPRVPTHEHGSFWYLFTVSNMDGSPNTAFTAILVPPNPPWATHNSQSQLHTAISGLFSPIYFREAPSDQGVAVCVTWPVYLFVHDVSPIPEVS